MQETPRSQLVALIDTYTRSVCDDPKKCEGLIRDLCQGDKKEVSALLVALAEGVPQRLLATSSSKYPVSMLLPTLEQQLFDNKGLDLGLATWSVESWALALGVISEGDLAAERKKSEEEAARKAEEEAAEAERQQKAQEEEARKAAEAERQRKAQEEKAHKEAEAERQRKAQEEEARKAAEVERQLNAQEEKAHKEAEAERQRKAQEEKAHKEAEAERQRKAQEEKAHKEAEAERQRKAQEEKAHKEAEAERQRKAQEEKASKEAESQRKAKEEAARKASPQAATRHKSGSRIWVFLAVIMATGGVWFGIDRHQKLERLEDLKRVEELERKKRINNAAPPAVGSGTMIARNLTDPTAVSRLAEEEAARRERERFAEQEAARKRQAQETERLRLAAIEAKQERQAREQAARRAEKVRLAKAAEEATRKLREANALKDKLANRSFWNLYQNYRMQDPHDTPYYDVWKKIRACDAEADFEFYQRHPERELSPIGSHEKSLVREWISIVKTIPSCKARYARYFR